MLYRICAVLTAMTLLTNCAAMTVNGSGCAAYGEARLTMPVTNDGLDDDWFRYVVETDTRMTAVCR